MGTIRIALYYLLDIIAWMIVKKLDDLVSKWKTK